MSKNSLLRIIIVLLFVIVIGTPLFYFRWGVYPYTLAKQLFFQGAVEITFFLWLSLALKNFIYPPKISLKFWRARQKLGGRAISDRRYRPRLTPLTAAIGVFLLALLATAFTGVDVWRSFWSSYERGIGVVAFLHLAALGVIVSSLYKEIPWRRLFYASLATSFAIDVIAFAQLHIPDLLLIENPGERPGATFGNPTFMAGYLIFHIFLAVYLFFDPHTKFGVGVDAARERQEKSKASGIISTRMAFIVVATLLNIYTVFVGQTRGDVIALAAGFAVLLIMLAIYPPEYGFLFLRKRRTYTFFLLAIVLFGFLFFFTRQNAFWERIPGLSRFRSLSFSLDSSDVAPRLFALRAGWQGFLERPLLGWGPENFTVVYDRHYDPSALEYSYSETRFDKPHNFLLEYAVAGGIFLLAALLFLFGAAIYEAIRQKDRLWTAVFLSSLAAYVTGQFFIFETIGPLLMLYLFFGMTDGAFRTNGEAIFPRSRENNDVPGQNVSPILVGSCAVLALVPLYTVNVQSLSASYYQYSGFQNFLHQEIFLGLRSFEKAVLTWTPYAWNFKRDYAIAVAGQYFNYPGTVSDEDALNAIWAMEKVRDEHPRDAFNHYALVNLYNEVSSIDPKQFLPAAEAEAKAALSISPGRQEIYFYLAKTKTLEGDYRGALDVLKKALDENPNVPDSHFYYGLVLFATGDKVTGYGEIKTALAMGRTWKTFHEPRVVAGFFADAGHLDEAIALYETAWGMSQGGDLDTEVKLGVIYFYAGQYDKAKQYLEDALKKFDVSKSSSYEQLKPILEKLGIRW